MEMNTRLQVEHPVTEGVTGIDLVKEQILVASGKPFSFKQEEIKQTGHAIELRICAEDPVTFLPSAGKVIRARIPQGPFVRFDSYIYSGCTIPIYYDPMIGKLIVWGPTRDVCIARLKRALAEFAVAGIKTNVILLKNILDHQKFLDGSYTTQFVDKELAISDTKTFFKYVDDEIFLISAAINAYKESQGRRVIDFKQGKKWRIGSRQKSMMRY
jgi:acetyl-CoA carboxylase biotin carboxylase subunit